MQKIEEVDIRDYKSLKRAKHELEHRIASKEVMIRSNYRVLKARWIETGEVFNTFLTSGLAVIATISFAKNKAMMAGKGLFQMSKYLITELTQKYSGKLILKVKKWVQNLSG